MRHLNNKKKWTSRQKEKLNMLTTRKLGQKERSSTSSDTLASPCVATSLHARWSTNLASEVNLPYTTDLRVSCGHVTPLNLGATNPPWSTEWKRGQTGSSADNRGPVCIGNPVKEILTRHPLTHAPALASLPACPHGGVRTVHRKSSISHN